MTDLHIEKVAIDSLMMDPSNARLHDQKNLDAIKGSLAKFGQVEPLVVMKSNRVVVGGNGRLEAMKAMGWTDVAVVLVDLDPVQATALAIALNRTAETARWDDDVLARTIQSLQAANFDLEAIGFSEGDVNALLNWDSDLAQDKVDGVDSEEADIVATIKVKCAQGMAVDVRAFLADKLAASGFEGVTIE